MQNRAKRMKVPLNPVHANSVVQSIMQSVSMYTLAHLSPCRLVADAEGMLAPAYSVIAAILEERGIKVFTSQLSGLTVISQARYGYIELTFTLTDSKQEQRINMTLTNSMDERLFDTNLTRK